MRVAFDTRAMQVGHQLRGIGEVFRNAVVELDARLPAGDRFVAAHDPAGPSVAGLLESLVSSGRVVEVLPLPPPVGRLGRVTRLRDTLTDAQQQALATAADVLVQIDFGLGVPDTVPTVLVVHDLIPLELGDRYPHRYWPRYGVARRAGLGVVPAASKAARRQLYVRNLTRALRRAAAVLADSAHTGESVRAFAARQGMEGIEARLTVARLGHRAPTTEVRPLNVVEAERIEALGLDRTPFVFFIGGVDERRRVDLLVDAFNHLRSRGRPLKLVLAGDTLATTESVGVPPARRALERSSYTDDIHLLGYVSEAERRWLYERAAALVFPSEHEGFGLPVVEALAAGCPVVAFDATAIPEVAGPGTHLVPSTWQGLVDGMTEVLDLDPDERAIERRDGRAWAAQYTWDRFGTALAAAVARERPAPGTVTSAAGDEGHVTVAEEQRVEVVDETGSDVAVAERQGDGVEGT